jgi:hypothetical protein
MIHAIALTIVLQMSNTAAVPAAVLGQAQREVVRLYRGIGVETEWRRPESALRDAVEVIRVILIPYETGEFQRRPKTVMGAAIRTDQGTRIAYVFSRQVETQAGRYGVSSSLVLACAIAHEIAHLLLPSGDHSALGLMRACWDRDDFGRAERGQLRFSDEEAELIRGRRAAVTTAY